LHDGFFYESDGLYGQSKLRKVDPKTGETLQEVTLGAEYFAEGLALVDDRLIQITWREGVAFIYDVNTFNLLGQYEYEGEGWGICYDGAALYMSNGSNSLVRRDPNTFAVLQSIDVTLFGEPVFNLNELECVGDYVYANVWMQDEIMKIDKRTGVVVGYIDARRLLTAEERSKLNGQQVLNGIAYDPVQDLFYITGKQWPFVFLVRLQ
jgi:glutaminyl-peptide cyclotransferase